MPPLQQLGEQSLVNPPEPSPQSLDPRLDSMPLDEPVPIAEKAAVNQNAAVNQKAAVNQASHIEVQQSHPAHTLPPVPYGHPSSLGVNASLSSSLAPSTFLPSLPSVVESPDSAATTTHAMTFLVCCCGESERDRQRFSRLRLSR